MTGEVIALFILNAAGWMVMLGIAWQRLAQLRDGQENIREALKGQDSRIRKIENDQAYRRGLAAGAHGEEAS